MNEQTRPSKAAKAAKAGAEKGHFSSRASSAKRVNIDARQKMQRDIFHAEPDFKVQFPLACLLDFRLGDGVVHAGEVQMGRER